MKYVELYLVADYSEVRGQLWISAKKKKTSLLRLLCREVDAFIFF